MSILRSLNIGISGLQAAGAGMSVISDNIANSNTMGFKSSRAEFQDVLATSLRGIDGGDQFGAGTRLAHIKSIFTQGNITRTESSTDLAVNGNGFFMVDADFGRGFTRDGSFHFDKEGYLINGDDYRVLGFMADDEGKVQNKIEHIRLGNTVIPANATKSVDVLLNLDTREIIKPFNIQQPDKTSNYSNSLTVYDNVGTARLVTIYYNKVGNNLWEYRVLADGADAAGGKEGVPVQMASGRLLFNSKGLLQEETETSNSFNFNKGAAPGQRIVFDFGKSIKDGGTGFGATTQYGSSSTVARHSQDGASAATLTSLSFDDEGYLTAAYNNGKSLVIGQISVTKFENNEGLFKVGKNLFKESRTSGQPNTGKPGEGGRGKVLSKSLELSNVDIANEFVGLMNAQRNFQANVKTLSTSDQMLQEVLNMKR